MSTDRGNIWLAVAGMVVRDGKILVVKKAYGATKGLWTLPGGFVNPDETLDEAAVREVREETGLDTVPEAILAVRSGILRKGIHDSLLVFRLNYVGGDEQKSEREIDTLAWLTPDEILNSPESTEFLAAMVREGIDREGLRPRPIEHKNDFGYKVFKMFQ